MTLCRLMQRSVLHFLLIVATLASAGANEPAGQRSASAPIRAEFKSGLLTLESRAAPLRVVLDRIGELAGFETVVVGEFAEEPRVTITLARVPLRAAIALVLGETSSIIVDGPAVAGSGRRAIAQLWLLGSAGAGRDGTNGAATASSRERETARDAKARSE